MDAEERREADDLLSYAYYAAKRGEWQEAEEAAQEARDLCDALPSAEGSAEARWILGGIKYQTGEFNAALPLLASAQQQFGLLNLPHPQCAILYLLVHCHLALERPAKARYALNLARNIMLQLPTIAIANQRWPLCPDHQTLNRLIDQLFVLLDVQT